MFNKRFRELKVNELVSDYLPVDTDGVDVAPSKNKYDDVDKDLLFSGVGDYTLKDLYTRIDENHDFANQHQDRVFNQLIKIPQQLLDYLYAIEDYMTSEIIDSLGQINNDTLHNARQQLNALTEGLSINSYLLTHTTFEACKLMIADVQNVLTQFGGFLTNRVFQIENKVYEQQDLLNSLVQYNRVQTVYNVKSGLDDVLASTYTSNARVAGPQKLLSFMGESQMTAPPAPVEEAQTTQQGPLLGSGVERVDENIEHVRVSQALFRNLGRVYEHQVLSAMSADPTINPKLTLTDGEITVKVVEKIKNIVVGTIGLNTNSIYEEGDTPAKNMCENEAYTTRQAHNLAALFEQQMYNFSAVLTQLDQNLYTNMTNSFGNTIAQVDEDQKALSKEEQLELQYGKKTKPLTQIGGKKTSNDVDLKIFEAVDEINYINNARLTNQFFSPGILNYKDKTGKKLILGQTTGVEYGQDPQSVYFDTNAKIKENDMMLRKAYLDVSNGISNFFRTYFQSNYKLQVNNMQLLFNQHQIERLMGHFASNDYESFQNFDLFSLSGAPDTNGKRLPLEMQLSLAAQMVGSHELNDYDFVPTMGTLAAALNNATNGVLNNFDANSILNKYKQSSDAIASAGLNISHNFITDDKRLGYPSKNIDDIGGTAGGVFQMLNILQNLTYTNPFEFRQHGAPPLSIVELNDLMKNQIKNSNQFVLPDGDNAFKNFYNLAPIVFINSGTVDNGISNTQRGPPPDGGPPNVGTASAGAPPPPGPPPPPPPISLMPKTNPNSQPVPSASNEEKLLHEIRQFMASGGQSKLKKTGLLDNPPPSNTVTDKPFERELLQAVAAKNNRASGISRGGAMPAVTSETSRHIEANVKPSMMATLILTNYNSLMNSFAYYNTKENVGSILSIQLGGNLLCNTIHRFHSIRIKKDEVGDVYNAIKVAALKIGSDIAGSIASRTFVVESNRPDETNKLVINLLGKVKEDIALTKGGKLLLKRLKLNLQPIPRPEGRVESTSLKSFPITHAYNSQLFTVQVDILRAKLLNSSTINEIFLQSANIADLYAESLNDEEGIKLMQMHSYLEIPRKNENSMMQMLVRGPPIGTDYSDLLKALVNRFNGVVPGRTPTRAPIPAARPNRGPPITRPALPAVVPGIASNINPDQVRPTPPIPPRRKDLFGYYDDDTTDPYELVEQTGLNKSLMTSDLDESIMTNDESENSADPLFDRIFLGPARRVISSLTDTFARLRPTSDDAVVPGSDTSIANEILNMSDGVPQRVPTDLNLPTPPSTKPYSPRIEVFRAPKPPSDTPFSPRIEAERLPNPPAYDPNSSAQAHVVPSSTPMDISDATFKSIDNDPNNNPQPDTKDSLNQFAKAGSGPAWRNFLRGTSNAAARLGMAAKGAYGTTSAAAQSFYSKMKAKKLAIQDKVQPPSSQTKPDFPTSTLTAALDNYVPANQNRAWYHDNQAKFHAAQERARERLSSLALQDDATIAKARKPGQTWKDSRDLLKIDKVPPWRQKKEQRQSDFDAQFRLLKRPTAAAVNKIGDTLRAQQPALSYGEELTLAHRLASDSNTTNPLNNTDAIIELNPANRLSGSRTSTPIPDSAANDSLLTIDESSGEYVEMANANAQTSFNTIQIPTPGLPQATNIDRNAIQDMNDLAAQVPNISQASNKDRISNLVSAVPDRLASALTPVTRPDQTVPTSNMIANKLPSQCCRNGRCGNCQAVDNFIRGYSNYPHPYRPQQQTTYPYGKIKVVTDNDKRTIYGQPSNPPQATGQRTDSGDTIDNTSQVIQGGGAMNPQAPLVDSGLAQQTQFALNTQQTFLNQGGDNKNDLVPAQSSIIDNSQFNPFRNQAQDANMMMSQASQPVANFASTLPDSDVLLRSRLVRLRTQIDDFYRWTTTSIQMGEADEEFLADFEVEYRRIVAVLESMNLPDEIVNAQMRQLDTIASILMQSMHQAQAPQTPQPTNNTGHGIEKLKCNKCASKNYRKLVDVDNDLLCNKCYGKGIHSNRTRINPMSQSMLLTDHPKYGGIIRDYEEHVMREKEKQLTPYDKFTRSIPKNLFKGDIQRQLTKQYIAYGKSNDRLLNQTTLAVAMATHNTDGLTSLPSHLLANIYGGLSKLAKNGPASKYIDMSHFNDFEQLKNYISKHALTLLNNIEDL